MELPFTVKRKTFQLTVRQPANPYTAKRGYNEVVVTLRHNLTGDDAFFVLLSSLVSVESASFLPNQAMSSCTFLVSNRLGTSPDYTWRHFTDEIEFLVEQLKERDEWHRALKGDCFIVQPTRDWRGTAYLTIKGGSSTRTIQETLKTITPARSNRPKQIGTEGTFIVILPAGTREEFDAVLRQHFS